MNIVGYQIFLRITRFVILVIRPDYQKFCLRSTPEWVNIALEQLTLALRILYKTAQLVKTTLLRVRIHGNGTVIALLLDQETMPEIR